MEIKGQNGSDDIFLSLRNHLQEEISERHKQQVMFQEIFKKQEEVITNLLMNKKVAEKKHESFQTSGKASAVSVEHIVHPSVYFRE